VNDFTVETATTSGGFNFRRSDGKQFFLVYKDDGDAVLYSGADRDNPPQIGIVSFDVSVTDKSESARVWVLAYPNRPAHAA
jgi:hypothetical protein